MRIKHNIVVCVLMAIAINANSAWNGISDHSRANCANNESITWDHSEFHRLAVVSFHTADYMNRMGQYEQHRTEDFWATTRRSAAVHWGEGTTPAGYYLVQGWHWEYIGGNEILRATTGVDNCSIYDGWWNF
ncbi:MAG: hypothetical protein LEGION0403_FIIPPAGN_02722 [Legionella sp.]|uniref:hypothetical protein n=1 Tax=Legionella sp. TaxID=459 RepID=UPI003D0EEC08